MRGEGKLIPDLSVKLAGLSLKNPLIAASGTFGYGEEFRNLVDFDNIGAVITKTLTLRPKEGNPPPRIVEVSAGVLNSIGLENPGLEAFLDKIKTLKRFSWELIPSISVTTEEETLIFARKLKRVKSIRAVEMNLSCPNIKGKIIAKSPKTVYRLVKLFKSESRKIVIAKLSGEVTDIRTVARKALSAGADVLSLVNTFRGLKLDIENFKPVLGNIYGGVSGPGIKPLALFNLWQVYKVCRSPIIGGGGIMNWQDALEFIISGATCVSIGTANLVNPKVYEEILKGIISYMRRKKIYSLEEIRGRFYA